MTAINLDNSGYANKITGSVPSGNKIILNKRDGSSSMTLTIEELKKNPSDGTYKMIMYDKNNKNIKYELTVTFARKNEQETKETSKPISKIIADGIERGMDWAITGSLKDLGETMHDECAKGNRAKVIGLSMGACAVGAALNGVLAATTATTATTAATATTAKSVITKGIQIARNQLPKLGKGIAKNMAERPEAVWSAVKAVAKGNFKEAAVLLAGTQIKGTKIVNAQFLNGTAMKTTIQ